MPFIPDSTFGIAYALACLLTVGITTLRNNTHARIVSLIMLAHWFSLRGVNVINPDNPALWVAHDTATVIALLTYGKLKGSRLSLACAAVFFVVLLFDQAWWLLNIGGFEANAAVAECAGYLVFLMIAGASLGSSGGDIGSGVIRRFLASAFVEGGRSISGRAALSGQALASTQNHQEKGRGA